MRLVRRDDSAGRDIFVFFIVIVARHTVLSEAIVVIIHCSFIT